MTFEEAKTRKDYEFNTTMLELYIPEIRNNYLNDFTENVEMVRGAAVMEIGFVDIEINIASKAQVGIYSTPSDMTPVISYFCCIKHSDGEWESDDYIDNVEINWNSENWKELLEKDMFDKLDKYVRLKKYHFDKGND